MELENIILSEVARFRKLKAACFLSYVEYRPNTNTSNILKSRLHHREVTNGRRSVKEGSLVGKYGWCTFIQKWT
jgi:hypothetical protein